MKPLYVKKNGVVYKISGNGMPALYPAENVEYDNTVTSELQATDVQSAIDELSTRQGGVKNTAYGTCNTAGDVKDKVVTLVNATNWSLEVGTIVGVRFTYTNTYTPSSGNNVTLNVNNTGAKNIRYSDDIWTSSFDKVNPTAYGESDQTIYYMYDGTYWVWVSHSKDNDTLYNFKGNEFRSADGNNAGQEIGYGGNANYMVVNGHYYYNSNGPSTDIGASANDGAIYVQAYDEDNVTQIAQNYETGNLFVRSKVNGSWTEWKKTIANITANNTILSTDKTPFLTRQTLNPTGFSGYVREKLIGASYAWNQILPNGNFGDTSVWNASKATISIASNVATLVPNGQSASNIEIYEKPAEKSAKVVGHKYLVSLEIKPSQTVNVNLAGFTGGQTRIISSATANTWTKGQAIIKCTTDAIADFYIYSVNESFLTSDSVQVKNIQLTDLTLAFGSTIADYLYNLTNNGGITKLCDMGCPIDKYTPYGYGLYSVKTSGKKIVGKNIIDEVFEVGAINNNTGQNNDSDTSQCRMHNYVSILPNTTYVFTCGFGTGIRIYWYDGQKNFISSSFINNATADSPSNAHYLRIRSVGTYGNSYRHDMLVAIYSSGMNTTYEPYTPITYPLGNDELRGKFDLVNGEIVASGDVKESNGEIERNYGIVDLGTANYAYNAALATEGIFPLDIPTFKLGGYLIAAKYEVKLHNSGWAINDMQIIALDSYSTIRIKNSMCTTVQQMQTANTGLYLIYELATPTTEQSTPFADPMSLVGATTEEYIDTRDIPCPVGAERQYMGQSEDVVEIPSSPQSDGKRVLISEVSGGKEQVYWDIPKLYYKEYTVQGDGTKTYGDLLAELKPYYETLSEDEKTYSKVMMRATSSGNECLTFVGNYWYSRMGVNASGLWLDQIDFQYNKYFKQVSGSSITEETNTITHNVIALRVLTYTRAES